MSEAQSWKLHKIRAKRIELLELELDAGVISLHEYETRLKPLMNGEPQ